MPKVDSLEQREAAKNEILHNIAGLSEILKKYEGTTIKKDGYDFYFADGVFYYLDELLDAKDIKNARNLDLKRDLSAKVKDRRVVLGMLLSFLPEVRKSLINNNNYPEELLETIVQVHHSLKKLAEFYK